MGTGLVARVGDVAIVGGGAAGLGAALPPARARRQMIVVDGGRPRNTPARAAHGLLGLECLGVETTTNAAGLAVVAAPARHTSVPGVWAAGNVVNPGMQISEAAANRARVAMTIHIERVFQPADHALLNRQPERVVV